MDDYDTPCDLTDTDMTQLVHVDEDKREKRLSKMEMLFTQTQVFQVKRCII